MKIELGNSWSVVTEATDEELDWLDEFTSCEFKEFVGGRFEKGRFRMLDRVTRRFPTGMIWLMTEGGGVEDQNIQWADSRIPPCELDDMANLDWLRDYQQEAVQAVAESGRGLIKAPGGSGKTEMAIALPRVLPCEWLFVVHRADLVQQTLARYAKRTGEQGGTFEGGRWNRGTCNFTATTFQSLYSAMRRGEPGFAELVKNIGGLNVDEVHAQPADSYFAVTMAMENTYYRIGMSGTPLGRGDRETLRTVGALGPVVYRVGVRRLEEAGVLSRATVRMVALKSGVDPNQAWSWRQVYSQGVSKSGDRNRVLGEICTQARKPCMVFVDELGHGKLLAEELRSRGLRVDFAHGNHWLKERASKLKAIGSGEIDVLLCTVIFQEGIDVPELKSVVNGAGKSSAVAAVQRMWRGMRTSGDGDDTFELWDVLDHGQKWLHRHALARKEAYEAEGYQVEVVMSL